MTSRDRLALRLGISVVVLALLGLRVAPGVVTMISRSRARLEERRTLLAETNAAIRDLPMLERAAHELTGRIAPLAPRLLAGPTAPTALSDLSGRLTTIAPRHHAQLVSLDALPDSAAAGALRRLTATAVIATDFAGLMELLVVLRRDPLALRVDHLVVIPADPYAGGTQVEQLRIELRLTAWYLAEGTRS
ncbi:MAG: GspMb/PilO family protein [Gemmatimonadota bacterium]|nr:GspMb/PilO family protein [Gemmatimonadota bacterium]